MASMNPPWPPSLDAEAADFALRLTATYSGTVDPLGWVRWASDYRMHRGNGMAHESACNFVMSCIVAIKAGATPPNAPPGLYDVPWPPSLDVDAPYFHSMLQELYAEFHPASTASHPVQVDGLGWVRWSSDYRIHRANGRSHDDACSKIAYDIRTIWGNAPQLPGAVRQLVGQVKRMGKSFGDNTGHRIVHGCSYFPALCVAYQDWDEFLRQLDRTAPHQQYQRWLWRLNGWMWSGGYNDKTGGNWPNANLTVDPMRDSWFEDVLYRALVAANDRGIRVNLSSGDMNNWAVSDMMHWFGRVAEIAASVSPDVVWLNAVTNEMRGTWHGDDSDENVAVMADLLAIMKAKYPGAMLAGSDPGSQDKAGMKRLAPFPANTALIHDVRWSVNDALRRCFNTMYENYPDLPVVQDEPTGPNGNHYDQFSQHVYQPVEDPNSLFAIYTMQIITGQAATYFNDPALVSRQPLDSTWGFKELPLLWKAMEIPQNIGQGTLKPGHHWDAPLRVTNSGAERADCMIAPDGKSAFGVVSGGGNWNVPSGWDCQATIFNHEGPVSSRRVSAGETLLTSGSGNTEPVVVQLLR